jgi:23S rRNA (uracil1939-C5)-methyltransferase
MIQPGDLLDLDVTKATAGGRMLARHAGQVVLAWGAIPGERVRARVQRVTKGVAFADTVDILLPSPDRRVFEGDWRCGGNVLAHVAYTRQVQLKAEIVKDAFLRIGRVPLPSAPPVLESPEFGYRMRARLHADGVRLGFFREESHNLCDATRTGQFLPATNEWIVNAGETLARERITGLVAIEIAENIAGDERACHFELHTGADAKAFTALSDGLVGASTQTAGARAARLFGSPTVSDDLHLGEDGSGVVLRLTRDVRAFFQGNRYLLERFLHHVISRVPEGRIVDLYAGVGLFGLALAATARNVVLVEGDPVSGEDLQANARPFGGVRVERGSVESFLAGDGHPVGSDATYVVDPPRTGMSREALHGIVRAAPGRIVYVSCDVATLARDTRVLLDSGFELQELIGLDLFPNTAHIETVAVFVR